MSLECGIVGLPNVGKSTLFNTLTSLQVAAENFPFCTVDPNKGIVDVPDLRMNKICEIAKPKGIVPANVSFLDIAGLVKGASQGEGLGNQFLSHIRSVDAVAHVVRCFEDSNVVHLMGSVDPERDVEIIDLELCLSDSERAQKRMEKIEKLAKSGNKKEKDEFDRIKMLRDRLGQGLPIRRFVNELEGLDLSDFLTVKPLMYVANLAETELKSPSPKVKDWLARLAEIAAKDNAPVVPLSIALEYQISQLEGQEDRAMFLQEYGLSEPGLNRFIQDAYSLLGLITFFTAGEKEVRAWTVSRGQTAVDAAGKIHSDFAKGFIRAEVIHYEDFIRLGGEKAARDKGLQRSEGKEYIVEDGDIILFRFNV
ncbi:MAG: redox-regulated ATPase YchF [Deltaproteobacteria bacterium CG11_big_fil_rev_8_21_14_0_20_45_16]|nr:MAG: redox-regulated ATPase YchF [Deltaproteobacteria bacterium CG11_big_fil_rev_8_21_14_0_20_45_16]